MRWGILVFMVLLGMSCTRDKALEPCNLDGCAPGSVSYANDIVPIIESSCMTNQGPGTGCHDSWINEYDGVKSSIESGRFWLTIQNGSMPKLPNNFGIDARTPEELNKLECWICNGYFNN